MVLIGVDGLHACLAARAVPDERVAVLVAQHVAQLLQLALQRLNAVGLLYSEACQSCEAEGYVHKSAGHDDGLCKVGCRKEVIVESWQTAGPFLQPYGWSSGAVG